MKTVLDAVIEFKGELQPQGFIHYSNKLGHFLPSGHKYINSGYYSVCTKEEFNTLVDELSSNMGRATQTYAEHKKEIEDVKANCKELFSFLPSYGYELPLTTLGGFNMNTTKPVYTQAMCDRGDLPSVGMECLVLNTCMAHPTYEKCTLLFIGNFGVIYESESSKERYARSDVVKFKPIEPPVDLIDGKAYQFDYHSEKGVHGIYHKPDEDGFAIFKFAGGAMNKELVKNIKPLTVEKQNGYYI